MRAALLLALALAAAAVGTWLLVRDPDGGARAASPPPSAPGAAELDRAADLDAAPLPAVPAADDRPEPAEGAEAAVEAPSRRSAEPALHALVLELVDDRGEVVPEARVALEPDSVDEGAGEGPRDEVTRARDGRHTVERLARGRWKLALPDAVRGCVEGLPEEGLLEIPRAGPLRLVLVRPARVAGTVVDARGDGVERVEVQFQVDEWRPRSLRTDREGAFEYAFRPGRLHVAAIRDRGRAEWEGDFAPGESREGIVLAFPEGGWIVGEILDVEGDPLPAAGIVLFEPGPGVDITMGDEADEEGRFRLGPVPAGDWTVGALLLDETEEGLARILQRDVRVEDGQVVEIVLRPEDEDPVRLHGTVLAGLAPDAPPVRERELFLLREGEQVLDSFRGTRTDDEGRYSVVVPDAGPYVVYVEMDEMITVGRVHVPRTREHRLDLRVPSARILGRVVDEAGEGVSGYEVFHERIDRWLDVRLPGTDFDVRVDDDGRFAIERLAAGTYVVHAVPRSSDSGWSAVTSEPIVVPAGATVRGVELRRTPSGTLVVHVRAGGEEHAGPCAVYVRDDRDRLVTPVPQRARGGRAELRFLGPGSYRVMALAADGRTTGWSDPVAVRAGEGSVARLDLAPGARLVARVEGEGVGAAFRLFDDVGADVTAVTGLDGIEMNVRRVVSTAERAFGPLPPGRYRLEVRFEDGSVVDRDVELRAGRDEEVVLRR